jgi:hypothetical protein
VAELTPAERGASGAPDDWSAKDLVAHVATWRERGAADLDSAVRGELPPEAEEFDEANRAIFEETRGLAWEEVLRRAAASWDAFSKALDGLTEEILASTGSNARPGRPLWRRITVDAGNHPGLHYAEFARRRGRSASATRWMETLTPRLLALDSSPEWRGVVLYNLACHFAQAGMPDRALLELRTGLGLNPGLKEWSQQDSDLAPLRGLPGYQTLYEE